VILQTPEGQFYFNGKSLLPSSERTDEESTTFSGVVYTVKHNRLVRLESDKEIEVLDFGRDGLPDDEVRDISLSPNGELYVATSSGIGILSQEGKWRHLTGRNGGLPVDDVTCLSVAADGTLWVGTRVGAARRWPNGPLASGIIVWARAG
jgi:ligand-binding sensor domain-containing protein